MVEPNWTLEWLKIAQGLFGTLIGGGLVLLGGWLADRRKQSAENIARNNREQALLTAMVAVRNYVAERINEWSEDGHLSRLEPLRTAQSYVHRLIDKAPGESESLMIGIVEIGLQLDALISTRDRRTIDASLADPIRLATVIENQVEEIGSSLEQFDIISGRELSFLTDDDIEELTGTRPPEG